MKTFKTRGLVLREYEAKESDKRLLLLCKEHGRLFVYARGARKPRSKLLAAAQLFTYSDMVIAQGTGFYSLAQAQVVEGFYGLREDYDALCVAHLIAEVCEKTIWENERYDDLLRLALAALTHLCKPHNLPPGLVCAVFMHRFFACHGVAPPLDICCRCGSPPVIDGPALFCPEGLLCDSCRAAHTLPLSASAVQALRHIQSSALAAAFRFTLPPPALAEVRRAAQLVWRSHFDWELVAERFC